MRRLCFLGVLALLLAASACCDTVTVSPTNMNGWSVVVNRFGLGYFTTSGVLQYETTAGFPSGRGAFYAMCQGGGQSTSDKTPDTVWLGVDTFNGQPLAGIKLNQIKKLQYTAYVSDMPTVEDTVNQWKYPREPITLQFVVTDNTTFTRNLWFRPWSNSPEGFGYGGNPADQLARWITYDCINCTPTWTGPRNGGTTITPVWSEPEGNQVFHSWAEVCAVYGEAMLVATSTTFNPSARQQKSPGWDNSTNPIGSSISTGTGMPLNFEVGARKFAHSNIWSNQGSNTSWYRESVFFKGYVDTFTMGIDYGTPEAPNVVETTFDFEPDETTPKPELVSMNLRSACEGDTTTGGNTTTRTGYAAIWESTTLWKLAQTRFAGMCKFLPSPSQALEGIYSENGNTVSCTYFDLTDGSAGIPVPLTVRVRDDDGALFNKIMWGGEYLGITGEVRRKPWGLIKMRYIWSTADNVTDYTYVAP